MIKLKKYAVSRPPEKKDGRKHHAVKRTALIAIFILLALCLAGCGETELVAAEPEATPTLSVKLIAADRDPAPRNKGTPSLITEEHILYLEPAFADCIAPDAPITRGDACRALYKLLENPIEGDCSFSDVDEDDALYEALGCLTAWGVVNDSTGGFNPRGMLSRAQLVTMLSRIYPPEPAWDVKRPYVGSFLRRGAEVNRLSDMSIPSFEDSSGHWASAAIENAAQRGWVEAGGKFYPDAAVTRAEFCRVMNRVLGRQGDRSAALLSGRGGTFRDLSSSHADFADVLEASCPHTFFYDGDREFWECPPLEPGFHRIDGGLFYVQEDGSLLRSGTLWKWTFGADGRYTTGLPELDDTIRDILLELGTDRMSDYEALRAAYIYCVHNFTYIYHDWYSYGFADDDSDCFELRALRFFKTGGGCCYDYAGGFGFLARALGYKAYMIRGYFDNYTLPHGFVAIPENGAYYIYDTEIESDRSRGHQDFDLFRIRSGRFYYIYYFSSWW